MVEETAQLSCFFLFEDSFKEMMFLLPEGLPLRRRSFDSAHVVRCAQDDTYTQ